MTACYHWMKTGSPLNPLLNPQPPAVGETRPFTWRNLRLAAASEQAARQSWLPIECQQLSAGEYEGSYQELAVDGQLLVRESQSQAVQKRGIMAPGFCTISFPCSTSPLARFSEFSDPQPPQVFLLPSGVEFDMQAPPGYETFYIRFDQRQLLDALRALDPARWELEPDQLTAFVTPGTARLGAFTDLLFSAMAGGMDAHRLTGSSGLSRAILDNIALTVVEATPVDGEALDYRGRRRALRVANAVRDYIDVCLERGDCPSIVEICAYAGVSQRTLQYGFRELLQMTPVAYLRILRLNRVRVELCAPSHATQTVTETATRWGFFHLGKFAQDYRQMFGESPSETLRQGSARIDPFA